MARRRYQRGSVVLRLTLWGIRPLYRVNCIELSTHPDSSRHPETINNPHLAGRPFSAAQKGLTLHRCKSMNILGRRMKLIFSRNQVVFVGSSFSVKAGCSFLRRSLWSW
jgi:hypothetical protein